MDDLISEFKKYAHLDKGVKECEFNRYSESIKDMTSIVVDERKRSYREIDVFSRLIMDRIIFLGTEVNSEVSNIIVAQLLFLESLDKEAPISIYINSPGGEIYSGMSIYDTMQFISPQIVTVCTGLGASMAAVLLAGGAKGKRYALRHSKIMIHQPSGGTRGRASDMEVSLKQLIGVKKELYEILAECTGKTVEQIEKDSAMDYWMTSQEAKEYGLIDDIFYYNK